MVAALFIIVYVMFLLECSQSRPQQCQWCLKPQLQNLVFFTEVPRSWGGSLLGITYYVESNGLLLKHRMCSRSQDGLQWISLMFHWVKSDATPELDGCSVPLDSFVCYSFMALRPGSTASALTSVIFRVTWVTNYVGDNWVSGADVEFSNRYSPSLVPGHGSDTWTYVYGKPWCVEFRNINKYMWFIC